VANLKKNIMNLVIAWFCADMMTKSLIWEVALYLHLLFYYYKLRIHYTGYTVYMAYKKN